MEQFLMNRITLRQELTQELKPLRYYPFPRNPVTTSRDRIESFNRWLRGECLNGHWFLNLSHTRTFTLAA